jgi:hypothetical protein
MFALLTTLVNLFCYILLLLSVVFLIDSFVHTHQQNGSVERKQRHIVETGLTILANASMPLCYWDEAFTTTCFLINRLPSLVLHNKSHFEV